MQDRTPLRHAPRRLARLLQVAAACLLATSAPAEPSLDEVIAGEVTLHQDGSVTVITASDGAIIHYDSFDVFVDEVVQFVQPSEKARVLNRVFGDRTTIEGTVLADGIVYIVNAAGIYIDGEAVVEVGGLVAAAGNITNEDFLAGVDRFELTGSVENFSDDVRAEQVALLGTRVANHGEIHAPDGTIAFVAGDRVVLTRLGGKLYVEVDGPQHPTAGEGVVQAGRVDAGSGGQVVFAVGDHYSLAINHDGVTRGGDVDLLGGEGGTILVQGEIDATGDGRGGEIDVIGDRVALIGATLDASGATGGGSIHVGGRLRGEGESARRTFVDGDSVLRADAIERGDGGEVVVWGDEAAVFQGALSARGGLEEGNGGFAEISSLGLLHASGDVDLTAPAGSAGTLLFDPTDIVIQGGTLDGDDTPDTSDANLDPATILFDDDLGSDPFVVYESEIEGTDANIVLEARHSISVAGTFDHDSGDPDDAEGVVVVTAGNDLTLRTRNAAGDDAGSAMDAGIDLTGTDWVTDGGAITIEAGASGEAIDADIGVGNLTSGGGAIAVTTSTGNVTTGDIDASGADGDTGGDAGSIDVRANVAGDLTVGDVRAVGGAGATGAGGSGGGVTVDSVDGSVATGAIDASAGAGATDGGAGGAIVVEAGDEDASGTSSVSITGDLLSLGGAGTAGAGGAGGTVGVRTISAPADPSLGGGPVTVLGNVDTTGGSGAGEGGAGGRVVLAAAVSGDLSAGDVVTRGGAGNTDTSGDETGGAGGSIILQSIAGAATAGNLDASGGDGGVGGDAGPVALDASVGEITAGDVRAVGGVGVAGAGGAGGSLTIGSADGAVSVGALDASGGVGATDGGAGGAIVVEAGDADGSGTSSVTIAGDVLSRGGVGAGGAGGVGGSVDARTLETPQDPPMDGEEPPDPIGGGPLTVLGSVDVSGGDGAADGGAGGAIDLEAQVSGDLSVADLFARGGDADTDAAGDAEIGGAGGSIEVTVANGALTLGDLDASGGDGHEGGSGDTIAVVAFEGDLSVGSVTATGGAASTGAGGDGADVDLGSGSGTVSVASVDASGGDGATSGGSGGLIRLQTGGVDGGGTNGIEGGGDLTARGGSASAGDGGAGGGVQAVSLATPQDPPMMGEDPPDPIGGGPITVLGNVDASGGDGAANGGRGGTVIMNAMVTGDLAVGDITTRGGNADTDAMGDAEDGGSGGSIGLATDDGSVTAGALDASGGEGSLDDMAMPEGMGGASGSVEALAGRVGSGDATIEQIRAVDGSNGATANATVLIDSAGDVAFTGTTPHVVSTERVTIRAGESLVLSGTGPHIDMGDGATPGLLTVQTGNGIGSEATPLHLRNAQLLALGVTTSGGIHVRQSEGGDLQLSSTSQGQGTGLQTGAAGPFELTDAVAILGGDGDVDIQNDVGDVVVQGDVRTSTADGATGSIRLGVSDPDAAIRFAAPGGSTVDSAGSALIDGNLVLTHDATVNAADDATFAGTVDSGAAARSLTTRSEAGVVRFQGDVGAGAALRNLVVEGDTVLDPTSGSAMTIAALQDVDLGGDVNTVGDDATSLAVSAGFGARFGGDVGTAGRLTGLALDAPEVVFDGAGAQTVLTGAEGIAINAPDGLPSAPQLANVGKAGGDLRLESVGGDVDFGPNQKLTVDGIAELVGDTVAVGDVNALELHVDATTAFLVRTRPEGTFIPASGTPSPDGGTDLFANVLTTTVAPTAVGGGNTPTFVTASGGVGGAGAGSLLVNALSAPITSEDLVETGDDGETFFDLGLAATDPGNETEPDPERVEPLLPARPGQDVAAGSATPPSADAVLAFLECADASPDDPGACAPSDGSALDSERGDDLAARYRRLFGSGPEAGAAQRLVRGDAPEREGVLRDVATLLAQLRLLGMEQAEYERLRDRLLDRVAGPERREAVLADVRSRARGVPL